MPTARVVIEDIYVIKIIKQLEAADIKVPKDISIASFSNIPVAEYFSPSLTSVKLNGFKLEQGLVKYF